MKSIAVLSSIAFTAIVQLAIAKPEVDCPYTLKASSSIFGQVSAPTTDSVPADDLAGLARTVGALASGLTGTGIAIWYIYNDRVKVQPAREAALAVLLADHAKQLAAKDVLIMDIIKEKSAAISEAYNVFRSEMAIERKSHNDEILSLRDGRQMPPFGGSMTEGPKV